MTEGPLTIERLRQILAYDAHKIPDGDRVIGFPRFEDALLHAVEQGWVNVYWLGGDEMRFELTEQGRALTA